MNIAIAINVYQEVLIQLQHCIGRIRSNMPDATVMIFLDGIDRPDVRPLAGSLGCGVTNGAHLGYNDEAPLWWLRMLTWFHESTADICFKLDPDTMVDRAPKEYPAADYFGTIDGVNSCGIPYIQGGVTGISRATVKLLIESELLLDPKYKDTRHFENTSNPPFVDDKMIGSVLHRLGIRPSGWSECLSRWRDPIENDDQKYAIVHPRYYGR
jgi:hypothetical protein